MNDFLARQRAPLHDQLEMARKAADALRYSWQKVVPDEIDVSDPLTQEVLEAMTARFARLEDIPLKRVLRAVADFELAEPGRLIDTLNLAEKLGLIDDVAHWIELRELRNLIVHEYELDDLSALHRRVYHSVPSLLTTLARIETYFRSRNHV